jgi:hypothetical protein
MAKDPRAEKNTTSIKQIAKDAVRGGPKSAKKNKRPTGRGQKG